MMNILNTIICEIDKCETENREQMMMTDRCNIGTTYTNAAMKTEGGRGRGRTGGGREGWRDERVEICKGVERE